MLAVIGLIGFLMLAGQVSTDDGSQPIIRDPSPDTERESSIPVGPDRGPVTPAMVGFDGPVLDVSIGAIMISTDFDGRITALELDSGNVTRTPIRTSAFVTVDGQLVVQTGCGAWQTVEVPEFTLGEQLIGCGSYQPAEQRGADVVFFTDIGPSGAREVVVADGGGGIGAANPAVAPWPYKTAADGRVLVQATESELAWVEPTSGDSLNYADGRLIESGPGGVLWADCETSTNCGVWFGTPQHARVHRYAVDSSDGEFLARINNKGSRAVFFLEDDVLRIVTLETGHAREVANPGIGWSTATWSPDGLWLLDPVDADVVALNTLNGRTARFEGVPGDASPGWVALVDANTSTR